MNLHKNFYSIGKFKNFLSRYYLELIKRYYINLVLKLYIEKFIYNRYN